MVKARDVYTFLTHIKLMPVIIPGYVVSIQTYIWINAATFNDLVPGG